MVLSSLRHQHNRVSDLQFLLETLGGLWAAGVSVDWKAFSADEERHRIPLPGYAFERKRYWVDAPRRVPEPEPVRIVAIPAAAMAAAGAGQVKEMAANAHQKGPDVMENRIAAQEIATVPSPRYDAILNRLKGLASELTGVEEQYVATDVHFFQAGIDSLLLLQAIQAVEKRLGVRVSLWNCWRTSPPWTPWRSTSTASSPRTPS